MDAEFRIMHAYSIFAWTCPASQNDNSRERRKPANNFRVDYVPPLSCLDGLVISMWFLRVIFPLIPTTWMCNHMS